jgi:hypothetical protein
MAMREDCSHYESRAYDDDGEVARFCTLGLAPEAPWRCPDNCASYERILMIGADFEAGSLAHIPAVEPEPDVAADEIIGVLADAEAIVHAAEPDVIAETDGKRTRWWRRRRSDPDDGDDFRVSSR